MKKLIRELRTTEFINKVNELRKEAGKPRLQKREIRAFFRRTDNPDGTVTIEGWYSPAGKTETWHTFKRSARTDYMNALYGRYVNHLRSGSQHKETEAGAFVRKEEAKRLTVEEAAEALLH